MSASSASKTALALVEQVITSQWESMVRWQAKRGYRWTTFDAEDTVQKAAVKFLEFAHQGRYNEMSLAQVKQAFSGIVRQSGYHLWASCKHSVNRYDSNGDLSLSQVGEGGDFEEAVDSRDLLESAYGEFMWIAEAQMAGRSLNDIGRSRLGNIGTEKVKRTARNAAARARELVG